MFLDSASFGTSPAFYLDCGDCLLRTGQPALGVRVLTDVADLRLEDARLLRIVAHRLQQIGERDLAIDLFEKVLRCGPRSRRATATWPWPWPTGPTPGTRRQRRRRPDSGDRLGLRDRWNCSTKWSWAGGTASRRSNCRA